MLKKRVMCLCSVAAFIAFMGFTTSTFAGNLEPTNPPAPTMKTLNQIYARLEKIDDGAWSKLLDGNRFSLVMNNEAVVDHETHLVWERSPSQTPRSWGGAISHCFKKQVGGRKGWRSPTIAELASLVDVTQSNPSISMLLKAFSPNVQSSVYWSSTTHASNTTNAWSVFFGDGNVFYDGKANGKRVWCVRGGL